MSLRTPSALSMLGFLQQHGLTFQLLRDFAALCRAGHTGAVTFHLTQGRIRSLQAEARSTRRVLAHDYIER